MISNIAKVGLTLKKNKDKYLSINEIIEIIEKQYSVSIDRRSVLKYITSLVEIGFCVDVKVVAHNTKIFCYKYFVQ